MGSLVHRCSSATISPQQLFPADAELIDIVYGENQYQLVRSGQHWQLLSNEQLHAIDSAQSTLINTVLSTTQAVDAIPRSALRDVATTHATQLRMAGWPDGHDYEGSKRPTLSAH